MPKLTPSRLSGLYGMEKHTALELHQLANWYEKEVNNPDKTDDPKYLLRWAKKIRNLAEQKEKALEHKQNQK